jgi:Rad3-related DNA helicase
MRCSISRSAGRARSNSNSVLCIRNIVPAPYLKPRFESTHTTALFSATLSPWNYFGDMLGMPDTTAWVDVESPFVAEQLSVQVARHISTRYQHRQQSLKPIAELMGKQYARQRGNYLAFFSSFDYMEKAANQFSELIPTCRCGGSRAAWTKRSARSSSTASRRTAKASASPCWAARSAWTCRARA